MIPADTRGPAGGSTGNEDSSLNDQAIQVLESITDGFIALDSEWRITYVNAEAERLNSMRREDMLGRNHWDLFPAVVGTMAYRELVRAAAERVPVEFETYYAPWRRWFRVKAHPVPGGGLSLFYDDVTARKAADDQRKQTEDRLRESQERFRAIFEATPECVKVVGADGTLLHMNSAGLALVGADSADAAVGKNVYDLIAPEFRDVFRQFNERVCRGEKGTLEFDIIGLKGRRRHMETHAVPLREPDGAVAQLAITHDITDRKRSEQAARLLGAIVDSSDDAIISKSLDGIVTSWNLGAERLFGYTSEEAVGKPITMIIPQDRLGEEPEILGRLQRGERVDHFETVRKRKDGGLLNISLTISPVKDAQGTVAGASKIARDITGRKRAEEAIKELNRQLGADLSAMARMQQISTRLVQAEDTAQLLDEILAAGMEITGAEMGNIQLLEGEFLRIAAQRGFDAAFLDFFNSVGHGVAACGTALERAARVIIEDVAESPLFRGTPAREVMLAAGVRAVQSTPLVSRAGHVLGMFSTHYRAPRRQDDRALRMLDLLARQAADLIERKQAEAALLASEARFRQLADSMPQIVWTAQPDGYTDYYNERWYEFTGASRDQFGDISYEPLLHPDDTKRCHDTWYGCVASGEPYRIEYRFRDRLEKRWRWFMGRALPVRDGSGKIVKWFGSCTDIDDQKRIEEELRRANQDLEQFAYSASHDLQEPLRMVSTYGELLKREFGGQLGTTGDEYIGYTIQGALRLEQLLRDLRAYTLASASQHEPAEDSEAETSLDQVLKALEPAIRDSGAVITRTALPRVRMHAFQLEQLFQNLIGNAIRYRSSAAPQIHIAAEKDDKDWLFSVKDNGIGIDREYKEQVFEIFKRLHSATDYPGTGMGLAICQRIVERAGGRIWVESSPGRGSTFFFTVARGED